MRSRKTPEGRIVRIQLRILGSWLTRLCEPVLQHGSLRSSTSRNDWEHPAQLAVFGPHFRHVDLSLFKNFPVTERVNMQFRVETFNISNTPNFFIANNNSSNQEFGNASLRYHLSNRSELHSTAVSVRSQSAVLKEERERSRAETNVSALGLFLVHMLGCCVAQRETVGAEEIEAGIPGNLSCCFESYLA